MSLYGALDLAGSLAAFAVADDAGNMLIDAARPMRGREAAALAPWITGLLAEKGLSVRDVTHWSVGSGPGSFTGMRLASALVKGWVFGRRDVRTRCVPTALIAAAACAAPTACILLDGRNREMLVFGVKRTGNGYLPDGFTAVWDAAQAADALPRTDYGERAVFAGEEAAVRKLLPDAAAELTVCENYSAVPLLRAEMPFDDDLDKLVYIRPAVFS